MKIGESIEYLKKAFSRLIYLVKVITYGHFGTIHDVGAVSNSDVVFVLIHTGKKELPEYVKYNIEQLHLFDNNNIILVTNRRNKALALKMGIIDHVIWLEEIKASHNHIRFLLHSPMTGFAQHTTERFFIVEDLMIQYGLKKVVHIENDNLVYAHISDYLDLFGHYADKLFLTRHNREMCMAGFMYIPSLKSIKEYTEFLLSDKSHLCVNDMVTLSDYAKCMKANYLPVLTLDFYNKNGLNPTATDDTIDETVYYRDADAFEGIFDAASIGQYIGGVDKIITKADTKGFINDSCAFNPSKLKIVWKYDENQRCCPYIEEENDSFKIINLHIHSKELKLYMSNSAFCYKANT